MVTLKKGMGQKQVIEDARALDGIIKYMSGSQSRVTIRDLVMTQNLEPKPVSRLLKILANAGIVEKIGKREWELITVPDTDPYEIAQEAAKC